MKKTNIPLSYGIFIGVACIIYFLVLSMFSLHTNAIYSIFNFVFLGVGLFLAISKYKKKRAETFKYEYGFSVIFFTGIIATMVFTGFFALYITELNPSFLNELLPVGEKNYDLKPGMTLFGLASMGITTSLTFSLLYMQWFKSSRNIKVVKEQK